MRHRGFVLFLVFAAFFHNGGLLRADNWKTVAARDARLGPLQIARLATNKVLITDQQCSQIFQPYVEPEMSVFITSDSILNAYHVLLEESVLRLEMANANELGEVLHFIWTNLDSADREVQGDRPLVEAARRRARIVVGTALRLLELDIPQADEATAAVINGQVDRVENAEGLFKPTWVGPANEPDLLAIDYSRFKPRGFYTANEALSRYFRAVSWLQAIPFHVEKDEELLAILLLGDCLTPERFADDKKKQQQYAGFFDRYREFLGERDDWDLTKAAAVVGGRLKLDLAASQLASIRETLRSEAARDGQRPQINDQIAYPGESGPSFRILSAYRTPDSVLFQKTLDPQEFSRPFPTGLEVCIALGSSYAARCLDDPQRDKLIATIEHSKGLFVGTSLGAGYYECLATLFDAPPAGAPPFMASDVWQAKSCQTALAGWAQWRHTWVLQNKQVFYYLCAEDKDKPVGFVEPNPAFFRRMRELAERTGRMFEQVKDQDPRGMYAVAELERLVRFLESKIASGEPVDFTLAKRSSDEERRACSTLFNLRLSDMEGVQATEFPSKALVEVKEVLRAAQLGELPAEFIEEAGWARGVKEPLNTLWAGLGAWASGFEKLAEKQLAGKPFTQKERDAIFWYGSALAELMFHDGCDSEIPRDDAPRVVDVMYNAQLNEYLEVGVGRPRIMYVLYPTDRGEVLCRGAVLPYYEFRSPRRLDDTEWRALLKSNEAPPPAFEQASFVSATGLHDHMSKPVWLRYWKWTLTLGTTVLVGVGLFVRRRRRRRTA